jgi:hypothetical protein
MFWKQSAPDDETVRPEPVEGPDQAKMSVVLLCRSWFNKRTTTGRYFTECSAFHVNAQSAVRVQSSHGCR